MRLIGVNLALVRRLARVRSLKCDGKLALSGRANLAKWCGKFTPNGRANSSQKAFFKS
ncbi:TPA: hypothetical protein R1X66_000699 [Campylobacter upsaliensis]|nr:hypothetical protein [Campylobacter upsaliensis]